MQSAPAGAQTLTLELPFPPEELQPNARPDRYTKARAAKAYKNACWLLACSLRNTLPKGSVPLRTPVEAAVTFVVRNMRRDPDNLLASAKPLFDAIVATGILKDDNAKVLSIDVSVVAGAKQCVHVVLREAAA